MMDYLEIGPNPFEENCVQVGEEDYCRKARIECLHYIEALRKKLGEEPYAAFLTIKRNSHDFGTYYEVICKYDDEVQEAVDYALKCESEGPATWAEVGMTAPKF